MVGLLESSMGMDCKSTDFLAKSAATICIFVSPSLVDEANERVSKAVLCHISCAKRTKVSSNIAYFCTIIFLVCRKIVLLPP